MSDWIIKSVRIKRESFERWKSTHKYFSFSRWVQMMLDMENGGKDQVIKELAEEFEKVKENEPVILIKEEEKRKKLETDSLAEKEEVRSLVRAFKKLMPIVLYGNALEKEMADKKINKIKQILLKKYNIDAQRLTELANLVGTGEENAGQDR